MGDDMGYAQLAHNLNSLQYECGRFERNVHESRATLAHASNFAETLGTMCVPAAIFPPRSGRN